MATHRGSQGEVTIDSTAIGELQRWEVDTNRPYLRDDAIGDDARTGKVDIPEWSGTLQLNLDLGDAQQKALYDILLANTDPTEPAFEGLVDGTGGSKKFTGDILPLSASIVAEKGNLVTMEITFNGQGSLTVSWS